MGHSRKRKLKACDPFNPNRKASFEKPTANQPVDESKLDRLSLRLKSLRKYQKKLLLIEKAQRKRKKSTPQKNSVNNQPQKIEKNCEKMKNQLPVHFSNKRNLQNEGPHHKTKITQNVNSEKRQIKFEPMKPNESFIEYARRINRLTAQLLEEDDVAEVIAKKKQKRKAYAEKKKQRKRKRRDNLKDDFSHLRDEVRFGEVVERPPTLTISPKSNQIKPTTQSKKRKRENDNVNEVEVNNETLKKQKTRQIIEQRMINLLRERAIQNYKQAKKVRQERENNNNNNT